jgi:hypothetical protein
MIETVITLLIYICVIALVFYLVVWVLTNVVGIPIPPKVIQILWVIFALIVILLLWRALAGGGFTLPAIILKKRRGHDPRRLSFLNTKNPNS